MVLWNDGRIFPIGFPEIALAEEYASTFNKASSQTFFAFVNLEKNDHERQQALEKAYETLFLSWTYRKEKKEQEKLIKVLNQKMTDMVMVELQDGTDLHLEAGSEPDPESSAGS